MAHFENQHRFPRLTDDIQSGEMPRMCCGLLIGDPQGNIAPELANAVLVERSSGDLEKSMIYSVFCHISQSCPENTKYLQ